MSASGVAQSYCPHCGHAQEEPLHPTQVVTKIAIATLGPLSYVFTVLTQYEGRKRIRIAEAIKRMENTPLSERQRFTKL